MLNPTRLASVAVHTVVLEPLGPWPPGGEPLSGTPIAAELVLSDDGRVETGIWSCTPGAFESRREGRSEMMHFVEGEGSITDADGTVTPIVPGLVCFLPDGWVGRWDIRETARKSYVMITTEPGRSA